MFLSLYYIDGGSWSSDTVWWRQGSFIAYNMAKAISSDGDVYQEEIKSLRDNLYHNNYPKSITSVPRNLDQTRENDTWKLTTVRLPKVKGLLEKIQKICSPYDTRTIFTSSTILRKYLSQVKLPTEYNRTKNCIYSIPCSCDRVYRGETCCPLKVRLV